MRPHRLDLLAGVLLAVVTHPWGCTDIPVDRCQDVVCAASESCDAESGACQRRDLCAGVLCADSATCDPDDGLCKGAVPVRCQGVTCGDRQSCDPESGACRDNPAPPTLSPMIVDRVGRPGIGNFLLNPFALFKVNNVPESSEASKDKYNADGVPGRWSGAYSPYLRLSLGLYDGLDGICGNQLLAGAAVAGRYNGLAALLSLDALQVNTSAPACTAYLAVEVGAADCGGWRPGYDVIDATYTFLSTGTVIAPVGDGVGPSAPLSDFFPFFGPLE